MLIIGDGRAQIYAVAAQNGCEFVIPGRAGRAGKHDQLQPAERVESNPQGADEFLATSAATSTPSVSRTARIASISPLRSAASCAEVER